MDKVKLELKVPKVKTVEYNGVEFTVVPFLGMAEQVVLTNRYIVDYFRVSEKPVVIGNEYNLFEAEFNLKNTLFQMVTNLDTDSMENDLYFDVDLWETVTSQIINYGDFTVRLDKSISEIKEQFTLNSSIGKVVSEFVEKLYPLLEKISDISPEQIQTTLEESKGLLKDLEENSVLTPKSLSVADRNKKKLTPKPKAPKPGSGQ